MTALNRLENAMGIERSYIIFGVETNLPRVMSEKRNSR